MLEVSQLSKAYGAQTLFSDASFQIAKGERVGLIGRNGHGKTTLLRMLVGQETPDSGSIHIPKHYRMGYVEQTLAFAADSLLDEACLGLPVEQRSERWRAEKTLAGLGFAHGDMDRAPQVFSGGFQVRLNLAKVLLGQPDLLLLDEPTNYLDVVSIRWLAQNLRSWKGELLLVTHDRSFLDAVITHTLAIHRGQLRKMRGDTSKMAEQLDREDEIHEKTRRNQEKKRREAEEYINRFRSKARLASNVQSRIKAMEKMGRMDRLEAIKDLDFGFNHQPTPAKSVLHAVNLRFGYDPGKPLVDGFSLTVGREDRIGIIGKNGKGKTTLLRLLAGELQAEQGEVKMHNQTRLSYYVQAHTADLPTDSTVEACVMQAGCERQRARGICGMMMFEGETAEKEIRVLSGGEKARVLLGRLLAQPANLLLLDEPTNHLDLQSSDALLQAIDAFPGAALLVTHNEMFLHELVNRFVVFGEEGVQLFEGSYRDFLEQVGWEDEKGDTAGAGEEPPDDALAVSRKELKRLKAEHVKRASRLQRPLEQRVTEAERGIVEREERIEAIHAEMIQASEAGDGEALARLQPELQRLQSEIEVLFEDLETASKELDAIRLEMDAERARLDAIKAG